MKQHKALRTLTFGLVLGGSVIAFTGVAHADCPAGFQNNMDTNISTGITVYFCTPLGVDNIAQYDSNITPNAPVATPEIASAPVDTTPVAPEVIAPYSSLPQVVDPNDPFPDLAFGDAIPGTFIQGEQVVSCPDFSSVAVDYNVARQELTTYCVKVYKTPQAIVDTTVATDSVFMSPLTDTPLIDPALVDTTSTDTTVKTGGLAGSSVRGD